MHDERTATETTAEAGSDFSRRGFVVTSLATGFAMAVRPVSAQTITTDATGLVAGEVKIPTKDGQIPGYRAQPEGDGPFPVVLVVQEIFGVHEHIKDVCRRLAKLGYLAVAPELFARQGDVSKMTDIQQIITKVVSKVPDEQVMGDLDAAVSWMLARGAPSVILVGESMGGGIVGQFLMHSGEADKVVALALDAPALDFTEVVADKIGARKMADDANQQAHDAAMKVGTDYSGRQSLETVRTLTPEDMMQRWMAKNAFVYLNDGSSYGLGGANHMRMNLATSRKTLKAALDSMAGTLKNLA